MRLTKLEYLKLCFDNRCFQKKAWMLSVFSVLGDDQRTLNKLDETKYALYRTDNGYFFKNDQDELVEVEGDLSGPFLYKDERITVNGDLCPNIEGEVNTTVGILLFNRVVLFECFGHLVPYHNGRFDGGMIKKYIDKFMTDDVPEGESIPEGKLSIKECLRVSKQLDYLIGFNNVFCKAASIDALTIRQEVLDLKAKLLKENPGAMTDPIKAAWIIEQLIALDMEIQLNGPSRDFFISKKFIDNARKKMFLVFGVEQDWNTGEYKLLPDSLDDGVDFSQLHLYVNTAISASFDRGKATGEGGAAVKDITRLTSRKSVEEGDCGSKITESVLMTEDQMSYWNTAYYVNNGKLVKFTTSDKHLIGKVLEFRTPNGCVQPHGNYCQICVGDALADAKNGISMECSDIPTGFMLYKLKQHHISGFKVIDYNLEDLFK